MYLIFYFANVIYMLTLWHPIMHTAIKILKKCFSCKICDEIGEKISRVLNAIYKALKLDYLWTCFFKC